jgi:nicotinic acid phosphoribosyltransferase
MNKGFIWTAYGINHEPLSGYQQLFAFNQVDAMARFKKEYGNDSAIVYLVADTFSQWD